MKSKRLEKLDTGFLSPTGEFFPCSMYEHMTVAHELLEILCPNEYFCDPEGQLREMGWVDIHFELLSGKYNIHWDYPRSLSPEQIHVLKPLVEDNLEKYLIIS